MNIRSYRIISAINITICILCIAVCASQTTFLISVQDVFLSEHPTYVPHSVGLLIMLLVLVMLACLQFILHRKQCNSLLSGSVTIVMIVLEVMSLRAAADQHYHMGMLISDYELRASFDGGWLLLLLLIALVVATVTQLLIVLFSALTKKQSVDNEPFEK